MMTELTTTRDIFTITRLNSEIKYVLQDSFPLIWVSGEISNLAMPRSGHLYFSLKDENSQIRCAMFRSKRLSCRFTPENGQQIIARVRINLYEARGDMQLTIEHLELAGQGDLQQQFEDLKAQLNNEGLFKQEYKKPLPAFVQTVGLITSPSGAAVRDIIAVLKRRYPAITIIIYPTLVQGIAAVADIQNALTLAEQRQECDLLIISRGGGSLEDLAAFNNDNLARQIFACTIPIIAAIGHEIDFTIADFVADCRAPTPSAAAELASPDQVDLLTKLSHFERHLKYQIKQDLKQYQTRFNHNIQRLSKQNPLAYFNQKQQQLDILEMRLLQLTHFKQEAALNTLKQLNKRLKYQLLNRKLAQTKVQYSLLEQRLVQAISQIMITKQNEFRRLNYSLDKVNPLSMMQRGYIMVQKDKQTILSAKELRKNDTITLFFKDGQHKAVITSSLKKLVP